jgi:hypothetical protein
VDTRKRFYDGLDADLKSALLVQIRNLWTHTSTAIEGNTLTLGETDFVLSEGLTIAGKPLRDHQEVVGHARAIELIYAMLDRAAIAERILFDLHRAVLTEKLDGHLQPGRSRSHRPPRDARVIGVGSPVSLLRLRRRFSSLGTERDRQIQGRARRFMRPILEPSPSRRFVLCTLMQPERHGRHA